MSTIKPFSIAFNQSDLDDLRRRLATARWPEQETVTDWTQGVPLDYLKNLCAHWENGYDLYRVQNLLNTYPQFTIEIDGLEIYFLHIKSTEASSRPLLLTHGWPGSVVEFSGVIGPLHDPANFNASADDAFDLVIPALPGYGFSGKPRTSGWGIEKIANAWDSLMGQLGYQSYFAQGGDWGAAVTSEIGRQNLGACQAIHVNMPQAWPTKASRTSPTEQDKAAFAGARFYMADDSGYSKIQSTRPQSIGYSLSDSPIAQAAWIIEKFYTWTDCDGNPENILSKDQLLDNVMMYWMTNSAASSARLYWQSFGQNIKGSDQEIHVPTGCSIFPKEIVPLPKTWAAQRYKNIQYWNHLARGGHFA
ncbi:MAG: epoxide hydrolase family protein, partial [Pseudomonadota bacterium]